MAAAAASFSSSVSLSSSSHHRRLTCKDNTRVIGTLSPSPRLRNPGAPPPAFGTLAPLILRHRRRGSSVSSSYTASDPASVEASGCGSNEHQDQRSKIRRPAEENIREEACRRDEGNASYGFLACYVRFNAPVDCGETGSSWCSNIENG